MRCEDLETSSSTSLLIFWAVDDAVSLLERQEKKAVLNFGSCTLLNYVASVLLMETCNGFAEILYKVGASLIG